MANTKVSAFTAATNVYDDTYFPTGEPGNGAAAANRKIAFSVMKAAVLAAAKSTVSVTSTGTKTVAAGTWLVAVAVTNAGGASRTISLGKTSGAGDFVDNYTIPAGTTETFNTAIFGATGGTTVHLTASGALSLNFLEI